MEEVENTEFLGKDVGEYLRKMYHRVERDNPVTGLMNGVRVIMFSEEKCVDLIMMDQGKMESAKMDKDVEIITGSVLFGGCRVGFNTNPESKIRPCFIEVDGQKIVCLAQGGECRYNSDYYSPGMNDAKSWTTPIIDESCPNQCCYKVLVCDDHGDKCEGSIRYYPQYNKFRGLFMKYCRNFDKYIKNNKGGKGKKGKMEK